MSEGQTSEWVYWVALDGDFARDYPTAEAAEHARVHERGHIPSARRSVWRARTEVQDVYLVSGASLE